MRPVVRYATDGKTADVAAVPMIAVIDPVPEAVVNSASLGKQIVVVEWPSQRHEIDPEHSHLVGCRPLAS